MNDLNVIKLLDWATISKTDDKIKFYKLRLFYEFFNENLRDEVVLRQQHKMIFSNEEILHMLYDSVNTLTKMQEQTKFHGEISSKFFFLDMNKKYKLIENMDKRNRYPLNIIKKYYRNFSPLTC